MKIRAFERGDTETVIALWRRCGLTRPWNDPHRDIQRKLGEQPELFLVGTVRKKIVASAMAGFDGHRGWVYYLAVAPKHQRKSLGRELMQEIERLLKDRGCPKINLQIRSSNQKVVEFYRRLGYGQDDVVSFGKRLIHDQAPKASRLSRSFAPIADGRSKVLVLGPDSSVSPLIFAAIVPLVAIEDDPATALALAGMMAVIVGIIQIGLGLGKLGFVAGLGVARAAGTMPPAAAPPAVRVQPGPTPWAANQASSRAQPSSAASLR